MKSEMALKRPREQEEEADEAVEVIKKEVKLNENPSEIEVRESAVITLKDSQNSEPQPGEEDQGEA